jgi:hypothetical protein
MLKAGNERMSNGHNNSNNKFMMLMMLMMVATTTTTLLGSCLEPLSSRNLHPILALNPFIVVA